MITVVSGLPRSGTSLMMQMLRSGGMELLTDTIRKADISNPRGYFEFERVKSLDRDSSWLEEAEGGAVKIVAHWLHYLPPEHEYSILFMERDIHEVLRSQEKMLKAAGRSDAGGDTEQMARSFTKLVNEVKKWLVHQQNMNVLFLGYYAVILNPLESARKVNAFLGHTLNEGAMAAAVDESLYRQRAALL